MNTEVHTAVPVQRSPNAIARDLICIKCGYNLRGLREDGLCPECAAPIENSLRGDLLQYADATWLKRLHLGTTLMLLYIALILIPLVSRFVVSSIFAYNHLWITTDIIAGFVYLAAVLMLTTPQLHHAGPNKTPASLRYAARLCSVAYWLACLMWLPIPGMRWTISAILYHSLLRLAGLAAIVIILVVLRRLAMRVPNKRLARWTRIGMWAFIANMAILLLATAVDIATITWQVGFTLLLRLSLIFQITLIPVAILLACLFVQFGRAFNKAAPP